MGDVVFIAILIAFFALCVVFVRACDRIIGDESVTQGAPEAVETEQAAA